MPRETIAMQCGECKERNYSTTKNRKTTPDRIELKKFCKRCRKHTPHKEVKWRRLAGPFDAIARRLGCSGRAKKRAKRDPTGVRRSVFEDLAGSDQWPGRRQLRAGI